MDNLLSRHRNASILVAVLFAQFLGLAVQVKRSANAEESRLIRVWAVSAVTPFEKALVWTQNTTTGWWHNYVYLRGVRAENRELKQQIENLRLEQVRLSEDAEQGRRLQLLLNFKEKFISKTLAAQVIGSSGSEKSRSIYIDKGSSDGVEPDQAVITGNGIIGKVLSVYHSTSLVLLINDQSSGVGVVLEKSRLQGVLRGSATGQVMVEKILSEEAVQPGEHVLTSGGDQIFPKGLDVGTVAKVKPGKDSFLEIQLQPAANLSKLEEVLVVTKLEDRSPSAGEVAGTVRAVDILTRRLPSVPDKPAQTAISGTAVPGTVKPSASTGGTTATGTGAETPGGRTPAMQTVQKPSTGVQGAPQSTHSALGSAGAPATPKSSGTEPPAQASQAQTKPSSTTPVSGATKTAPPVPISGKPNDTKVPPADPNSGRVNSTPSTKVPANPAVKPAAASGGPAANNVKPAVAQKTASPADKTADQSAQSAKPTRAPVEDNPQ